MDFLRPITPQGSIVSQKLESDNQSLPHFEIYSTMKFGKPFRMCFHYDDEVRRFREQCKRNGMTEEGEAFLAEFMETEEGKEYQLDRAAFNRQQLWESVESSGVCERHRDKVFKTYKTDLPGQRKAKEAVEAIASDDSSAAMLVLYGPPGTGKTHLGVSAVYDRYIRHGGRDFMNRQAGRWAIFTTQSLISRRVRDTYSDDSKETEKAVMKDLSTCSLLVVDEIGAGSGSDHEKQMLCDVLCSRYNAKRPTIMISNLNVEGLRAALGDRVMDRINEDAGSGFLPMAWASQRAAQKEAAK